MSRVRLVSENDQREISAAVAEVEAQTSGEVVPMIVRSSGTYPRASLIAASIALFLGWIVEILFPDLVPFAQKVFTGPAYFIFGFLIGEIPAVKRRLIPRSEKKASVLERAHLEFFYNHISKTKDRTGILILASEFEHMAVVLADEGIHAKVAQGTWNHVVDDLVRRIKERKVSQGFTEAIASCGEILAQHFPTKKNDTNELSNQLIVKD